MTEQKNFKPQTFGRFDLVGFTKGMTPETFQKDLKGKNNPNWVYSRMNLGLTDGKGQTLYVNVQDGYSAVKGKDIYVRDTNKEQLIVKFADRTNENLRKAIDDNSFIKVGVGKVKIGATDKEGNPIMENGVQKEVEVWDYRRFLTAYDMVNFLQHTLTEGMKVQLTGSLRYSEYNGKIQKEFQVQRVYILPEGDTRECQFKFTQNVLIDADSVEDACFESENIITINSKLYLKKKKDEYMVLPLPLVVRATSENKETIKKLIDMFFRVEGDTIRRINVEGKFNSGYIQTETTESDITPELLELIEMGVYTKEDAMGLSANKQRVDEMQLIRPVIMVADEKRKVDMADDAYTREDLESLTVVIEEEEEIAVGSVLPDDTKDKDDDGLGFLEELDI